MFLCLAASTINAQNKPTSTFALLNKLPDDTNKVKALLDLSEELQVKEAALAMSLAQEALSISDILKNNHWFTKSILEVLHPDFFGQLHQLFPLLTPTEVKICALEKPGLNDSQAGDLLSVNPESIRKGRYRLRKSLGDTAWEKLRAFAT